MSEFWILRTLRIFAGRFKAPLGIDGSMSSNDTPLMEYALTSAFLPSRNTGFLFHGASINVKFIAPGSCSTSSWPIVVTPTGWPSFKDASRWRFELTLSGFIGGVVPYFYGFSVS